MVFTPTDYQPFPVQVQRYPIFEPGPKTHQFHARTKERKHSHFNSLVLFPTENFIALHTTHLVGMSREETSVNTTKALKRCTKPWAYYPYQHLHSTYMAPKRSDELLRLALPYVYRCYPEQLTLPTDRLGKKATREIWRWWPVSRAMGLMERRGPEKEGSRLSRR